MLDPQAASSVGGTKIPLNVVFRRPDRVSIMSFKAECQVGGRGDGSCADASALPELGGPSAAMVRLEDVGVGHAGVKPGTGDGGAQASCGKGGWSDEAIEVCRGADETEGAVVCRVFRGGEFVANHWPSWVLATQGGGSSS
jgi:hypothetical protein